MKTLKETKTLQATQTLKALFRNPAGCVGGSLILLLALIFIMSFMWVPYSIDTVDASQSWAPPSAQHWFGADRLGRDIFSMMVIGSRVTVYICLGATLIAVVGGVLFATLIAYAKRPWSVYIERATDIWVAFPTLIIALIVVTAFGGSTASSMVAIGLGSIPVVTRTVLPEFRRARSADYTLLAVVSGASMPWLLRWHIVPSILPTLTVRATQIMGMSALAEAGLSYLGLGTPLPTPSWGRMLAEYQNQIYTHPGAIFVPGVAISAVIVGFNLAGDGLRDVLDPRMERTR